MYSASFNGLSCISTNTLFMLTILILGHIAIKWSCPGVGYPFLLHACGSIGALVYDWGETRLKNC